MSASTCAACGFANPGGALFCGNCGHALGRPCPSCGTVVSTELAFCTTCGAALAVEPRVPGAEERKVVSVLFADLVGFTGRAEELDPEDVGGLQTPYYARVKKEIENYGGTVEKFIGDAVMAVFGAPVAHEDDPARALLAALAVRDALADLNADDPELDLHIRIAVTTGEALVRLDAQPERGEGIAAGDVVNTASRMQSAAPVDGILVDDATRRASEHLVEYREVAAVLAKGKSQPVPAWEAVSRIARLGVDIAFRGAASLVGREAELAALRDALARAERARVPQLVTLVGVPGIGKSRLVWELYEALQTDPTVLVAWRQGRSLPYGEGVAYWALGEATKSHAGVLESDDASAAEQKLRAAVDAVIPDKGQARWVEAHLRPLAGLAGGGEPGAEGRSEAFAAWRRFFEAIAEVNPLVLVFEDLHWADDDLLDFVDYMADWTSGVPLVLVCTARPDLLDRRPDWGGGKRNATTISLEPLSDAETGALVSALLVNGALGPEGRTALLAQAGGNPLYAEEYVRMLGHAKEGLPLPDTVQGIIAARLDTLPADEKALIQAASIVGKVFWVGSLAAALNADRTEVEHGLNTLVRKEFVRRERRSSVAGESAYVFRHVLLRDVAYGQIPRARRADSHRRVAEWVESLAVDRPEDLADMVAHHYSNALELTRAAKSPEGDLAERARRALRDAGDRAAALNAFAAAARFYGDALDLWPEGDAEYAPLLFRYGRALFFSADKGEESLKRAAEELLDAGDRASASEAETLVGELRWIEGDRDEAFGHFEGAARLLADEPDSRSKAYVLANLARFRMIADEADRSIPVGLEALQMSERLGLDEVQANVLSTVGIARLMTGDLSGRDDVERAIHIAEEVGSPEVIRGYNNLASTNASLGDLRRAFELYALATSAAQRFGRVRALRWLEAERMSELYWLGQWDEALSLADKFVAQAESGLPHHREVDARLTRTRIRLARGDEAALEDSELTLDFARRVHDPQTVFPALAFYARAQLREDPATASRLADELLERWAAAGLTFATFWLADFAVVMADLERGRELEAAGTTYLRIPSRWNDAALAVVSGEDLAAAGLYSEIGSRPDEAFARERAAAALAQARRRGEAEAELARALAFFRSVGATDYLRRAESLLAGPA
ncbi:MAG TPA: AAA family ATPase [Gaiellaceae bacterium]